MKLISIDPIHSIDGICRAGGPGFAFNTGGEDETVKSTDPVNGIGRAGSQVLLLTMGESVKL